MMQIIDRRTKAPIKSAINRQRFLRRYRNQIKHKISKAISNRSITDIDQGESVTIAKKSIIEPNFRYAPGGNTEWVLPGNKEFQVGDRIKKDSGGQGQGGSKASNQGDGEDDFVFELSRE
jgi:uncharacterized sporulation protein YeaH/YhbH (DUF444 family)